MSHFSYKKVISINADEKTVFALGQDDIEDKAYTYERLVLDPESSPQSPIKKFMKTQNVAFPLIDYHQSFALSRQIQNKIENKQ